MEELNKSQIVLLTLLVSFVTSLATGIVTVSLMEQGVSPVTTTVNKIVERTKEIIIREMQDPIIVTETETVVVRQSDLVASAVDKNKDSSVIIYKVVEDTTLGDATTDSIGGGDTVTIDETAPTEDQTANAIIAIEDAIVAEAPKDKLIFAGRGVILAGGIIVSDASAIDTETEYVILGVSGERVPTILKSEQRGIAILSADIGTATELGNLTNLKRGQAMVVLSGADRLRVMTTVVSDIITDTNGIVAIEVDKIVTTPGSILINMDGNLVGISTGTSRTNGNTWFSSANIIKSALESSTSTDI